MANEEELRRRARNTAEAKVGFYIHLGIYATVNTLLILIWWFTGGVSVFPWFIFPLFIWGAGLIAHFIGAYRGPSYVEKMTEQEYKKLKKEETQTATA